MTTQHTVKQAIGPQHYDYGPAYTWDVPDFFNIGIEVCDKWADGTERTALVCEDKYGNVTTYSFDELKDLSDRFANALAHAGLQQGDRVGIYLPQSVETVIAHIAAYKLGVITVPLFSLFGPDAIGYRLENSGAKALVTDASGVQKLAQVRDELSYLSAVFFVEEAGATIPDHAYGFWERLLSESPRHDTVRTRAEDPALIIYTSGTTGKAKGALHAHRVLLGHLPGVEVSHDGFPKAGDLFWTPADWAWIGGLLDVLLPSLYHGVPVVAHRFEKFEPEAVFALLARHKVRNVFFPPTALKMLRGVTNPKMRWELALRSVASGGESLGTDLIQWGKEALGVTINEFYGQTECNLVVSSSSTIFDNVSGSMGRAVPGHHVAIVDDSGVPLSIGATGNIAIRRPDPVMFLGYWQNPEATREKFAGDYLLTGDLGEIDTQGYIKYLGRNDDVITSAGYRIGPAPIEECLMRHPAVKLAAVVGIKDDIRTEIIKAFVVLRDGCSPSEELVQQIQHFVRDRLAAHEYPRAVSFVDTLPTTPTGKLMRRVLKDGEHLSG